MDGSARTEVVDHRRFVMHARKERLPAGEVLEVVEIAAGNGWKPGIRDPAEKLCSIEEPGFLVDRAEKEALSLTPRIVRAYHVVGDAENVESFRPWRSTSSGTLSAPSLQHVCACSSQSNGPRVLRIASMVNQPAL